MSKLLTIQGIGPGELELLDAAGWGDVRAVAAADAAKLAIELAKANSMLRIVGKSPDQATVAGWIRDAKDLSSGDGKISARAEEPVAKRPKAGRKADPAAPAAVPTKAKRPRKTPKVQPTEPVQEELIPASVVAEPAFDEEAAIAKVSGPVNFEADPGVQKMLAHAPVAVPIPARMLAEKGILPSEIAVAPLLNRALGDLEVIVQETEAGEESPERKKTSIPTGAKEARVRPSSTPVHAETGANSPRGIDVARVRTVEEFQSDAPAPRSATSKVVTEDNRIALLRGPLPSTNANRKPSSPFYIRGVLHDRPLKVWFGGLFAVLLQLSLPLALVAAPLLILCDQEVKHFEWVPSWIIAFPIALPVFGLLYALVSTGAKCRVCGQRLYVPKNCLKNRKAHNALYFGHIGALAFHVMIFKWFNCTFCGTSIRIKK
jgi:hypothetical protein